MWGWFKGLVGSEPQAVPSAVPNFLLPQAANGAVEEAAPMDLVASTNTILRQMLSRQPVRRLLPSGETIPAILPVMSATLGGPDKSRSGSIVIGEGSESVQLTLQLRDAAGNYDMDSISDAIHAVLGSVPALKGHVKFADDAAKMKITHGDVWGQLKPMLEQSGKFAEQEIGVIAQFFDRHPNDSANESWLGMDNILVNHEEGKVQVGIRAQELNGDEDVARSGEQRVVDYLQRHKDTILAGIKQELGALGLKEDEIAKLDFDAKISDKGGIFRSGPMVEFGIRDAEGKLGTTQLATIDTDKIDKLFTKVLLHSNQEQHLPDIFGRIADGPSVASILRERLPDNAALKPILENKMFQNAAEKSTEYKHDAHDGVVSIGNVSEGADQHTLQLQFMLPPKVDLAQVRTSIVGAVQQMNLAAQAQQQAMAVGA